MSLSSVLSSLASSLTAAGVSAAEQPGVVTSVVAAIGGPPAAVTNALAVLPGAFGNATRIQGLVNTILNATTSFPAGVEAELNALPTMTSITDYNTAIAQIQAAFTSGSGSLASALAKIGL